MKGISLFVYLYCLAQICFSDPITPTASPTVAIPNIPGQAELLKAQVAYLDQGEKAAQGLFEKSKDLGNAEAALDIYLLYDCKYEAHEFPLHLSYVAEMLARQSEQGPEKEQVIPSHLPYLTGSPARQLNLNAEKEHELHKRIMEMARKSAEQGSPDMQLALCSESLLGDPLVHSKADGAEALKWARKAADQGYAKAEWQMAVFYSGNSYPKVDITPNDDTARYWLQRAADHGSRDAKEVLGCWNSEDMPVTVWGFLARKPVTPPPGRLIYPGSSLESAPMGYQDFLLNPPATVGGKFVSEFDAYPPQKVERMRDYAKITGNVHWQACPMPGGAAIEQRLEIKSMEKMDDGGKHLIDMLIGADHVKGEVVVMFYENTPPETEIKILSKIGNAEPILDWHEMFEVKLKKGLTIRKALMKLINEPLVKDAGPNGLVHLPRGPQHSADPGTKGTNPQ